MERWRTVWRDGIAPQLSTVGLEALKQALASDDFRLLQGATTIPPLLSCTQGWAVEAGCVIVFCGVADADGFTTDADGNKCQVSSTVHEAEEFFARVCFEANQLIGEPAACRHFVNFTDRTPRDEMRRQLLPEVDRVLRRRRGEHAEIYGEE